MLNAIIQTESDPVSILSDSQACIRKSENEWKSMKLEIIWGAEEQSLILLEDQRTLINLASIPMTEVYETVFLINFKDMASLFSCQESPTIIQSREQASTKSICR